MKVILVNGSPHAGGCTFTALSEIAGTLEEDGIETEIFQTGVKPISGCIACGGCRRLGRCVIPDVVGEFQKLAEQADGFVFGSPVHYAAASGQMTSFLDRAFFSAKRGAESPFAFKPAAVVVSARRAGTTAALEQLEKYLTISQMPLVSSTYWNMVHGASPDDVRQDLEGLKTMRQLGHNMAWLLKSILAGKQAGLALPVQEPSISTNFIR